MDSATGWRGLENQGCPTPVAVLGDARGTPYFFSPWIDLLVVANLGWPLLLFVDVVGGAVTHESLLFWQVFFVTTPHRWVTLAVVACDRTRTAGRETLLAGLAAAILLVCVGVSLGTGALVCLGAVDHAWNTWHFASQHHGIFRLYERRERAAIGSSTALWEKWLMRGFLLYVMARVTGVGWQEGPFPGTEMVKNADLAAGMIPFALIAASWWRWQRRSCKAEGATGLSDAPASAVYMTSVMALYGMLLGAAHMERVKPVLSLALASAVFHAVEYLAVVVWSTSGKGRGKGEGGSWLGRPVLLLSAFIVIIGAGNYVVSRGFFGVWVAVNLVVAFCHYAFDGIIWRGRRSISLAGRGAIQ